MPAQEYIRLLHSSSTHCSLDWKKRESNRWNKEKISGVGSSVSHSGSTRFCVMFRSSLPIDLFAFWYLFWAANGFQTNVDMVGHRRDKTNTINQRKARRKWNNRESKNINKRQMMVTTTTTIG